MNVSHECCTVIFVKTNKNVEINSTFVKEKRNQVNLFAQNF